MNTSNRSALIAKTYKVLKKHYTPVVPAERPLLEHMLYACCLENARHEVADDAFAKLQQMYFDWNEVRVTTVSELAEIIAALPDPADAAFRLKKCLQAVFETHYSFDLEFLKKQNLGKAVKELQRFSGVTSFAIAYGTQTGLGGHAIAVNRGSYGAFVVLGIISQAEADKEHVPGLERAIPKSKGVEFGSLLHQLGTDFHLSPFSPRVRSILLEITPDAKERLPKRGAKVKEAPSRSKGKTGAGQAQNGEEKLSPRKGKREKQAPPRATKKSDKSRGKSESEAKKSSAKRLTKRKPR